MLDRKGSTPTGPEVQKSLCLGETYLQSHITELTTLPQSVHLRHSGIQETLIFKDQITVGNHFG